MKIRTFIAILLPPELKKELSRIIGELKLSSNKPVKWVEIQNLHLTLKFLGDVDTDNIKDIRTAMEKVARGTGPVRLELNELGAFPNPHRVKIVWAGLGGEVNKLSGLQHRLESEVGLLGFPRESRVFQPHLTLGRVREQASATDREVLGNYILNSVTICPVHFTAATLHLMKSTLTSSGPIYSELGNASLA